MRKCVTAKGENSQSELGSQGLTEIKGCRPCDDWSYD